MDTQVIVVGAGPVGLMLAGELRLGGAEVVVLDRLAEPMAESRASTLHARTMEVLDQRGLVERFGATPNRPMGHFGGIPFDLSGVTTRFPGLWSVPQTQIEQVLAEWATELGADIRRGDEVIGIDAGEDRVRVHVVGPGGCSALTGAWVVGCDGEHSTVRQAAGIPMVGSPASRELLRADVVGIDVAERRFQRLPAGLAIAGRLPSGATRLMVAEYGTVAARLGPVTFAEFTETWQRVTGEDISAGTPVWLNTFDNASLLAERYRAGQVLLAGDAAHVQLPSGGQAINVGVQDAVNLGWKLAAEATGRAPAGLLDTYQEERREVGRRVLANVAAQSALLLGVDADPLRTLLSDLIRLPAVRDTLAGTIAGLDIRYGTGAHPLVGARIPHVALGDTTTTELLRTGHGVVLDLTGDPRRQAELRRAASACAVPVDVVCGAAAGPLDGLTTAVVRPDGHVAWVDSGGHDPTRVLHGWFG
ncbi:MAG TPA: FAD-dependent monooxygenase [Pseudonocardiaceae bacterium]|nr:FAD-dependent monooxygenase [Pseudonocardiaceae bacterium]